VRRLQRLARQPVLADERCRLPCRLRTLSANEALDETRQSISLSAADDPLEQASVLVRDVERRVAGADTTGRMGQAEEVTMGHSRPLAILDRLVGECVDRLRCVPAADRPTERATPAPEALDEQGELEQVRAGSRHPRQRVERRPACVDVA
jgi:hypothetical protein